MSARRVASPQFSWYIPLPVGRPVSCKVYSTLRGGCHQYLARDLLPPHFLTMTCTYYIGMLYNIHDSYLVITLAMQQ